MARSRNIKPSIMDNEQLAELKPLTRLFFIYLWMLADREGRLEDRPKRIAVQALAYDRTADVAGMLSDLDKAGFISRYDAAGLSCIQILSFPKHQKPHGTEKDSELPDSAGMFTVHTRSDNGYITGKQLVSNRSLTVKQPSKDALIPDSLKDESMNHDPAAVAADGGVAKEVLNAGSVCKAIRAKGVMDVNPSHPELRALIAQGVSVEAFEAAAEKCAKGNPPKGMAYLLAIVKRQLSEAASIAAGPAAVSAVVDPDSRSAIEAEGEAKGFGRWNEAGEQWHIYKARVRGGRGAPTLDINALGDMARQRQGVH